MYAIKPFEIEKESGFCGSCAEFFRNLFYNVEKLRFCLTQKAELSFLWLDNKFERRSNEPRNTRKTRKG